MRKSIHSQNCLSVLALALLLCLAPALSMAQLSTASINGVVEDPQGAAIPHATISLRNVATSVENSALSNSSGAYQFLNIAPGNYTLTATASGFSPVKIAEFTLTVNQIATFNFHLKVGTLSTKVTVEAAPPVLNVTSANLGTVIGTRQVNDLPLNGRNFTQLLLLTPGVSPIDVGQNHDSGGDIPAPGAHVSYPSVNGQTNRSNYFLTDGFSNNLTMYSTYAVPPIVDAMQEFKIVSHTDSAEFGSVLGGVVNVVTKSGTNNLHGSAWEYARNGIFNARTYFLPKTAKKADFSENQFGGSIGGPVRIPKLYDGRNKTFFFGAYQGLRFTQTSNSLLRVPTAEELNGNLSDWPTQIYNPFSTRPDPANPGLYIRDPFPGNQILPAQLIDARQVAWAKAIYPTAGPIFNSAGDNAINTAPDTQTQNEWTVRVDQKIGSNDSAFFRYSTSYNSAVTASGLPGTVNTSSPHPTNWGGSYVHVFSPSTVVQGQFSRTMGTIGVATRTAQAATALSAVGFAPTFAGGFTAVNGGNLLPELTITGWSGTGESVLSEPRVSSGTEVGGTLTHLWGHHSLLIGTSYTTLGQIVIDSYAALTYNAAQTGNPSNSAEPGDPLASFLLSVPNRAVRVNRNTVEAPGGVFSAFVQDSWRASTNLTFNYGLRYDITFIPGPGAESTVGSNGGIETGDMDFNNGTYILAKVPPPCSVRGHVPCIPGDGTLPDHVVVSPNGRIAHNVYDNFGPRVGFAYKMGDETVVRGAFGIVFDNWGGVAQTAQNLSGAWPSLGQLQDNNLNIPSTTSATPNATTQDPFAASGSTLFPAPTPFNQVAYFYDPLKKDPISDQWNIGIERKLNQSTALTVDYVGSVSRRLDVGGYYNTAPPGPGDPQSRAPYPYIKATNYDRSTGSGSYNGVQISLNRRYQNGLAYQVSYTWSKTINNTDGWFGVEPLGGQSPPDPYNPNAFGNRSVASFDSPNLLAVNTLYKVPVGNGMSFSTGNGLADYLLGNWQVNSIFTARSGQPFTPYISSDIANTGNSTVRGFEHLDLVGDPNLGKRTAAEWFNTAAFAVPANFKFGTAARNSLRGPFYWNLDASIFRQFPIGNERGFELRLEAFNVLNDVVLGQPHSDWNSGSQFGTISSTANTARELQLALKFIF
jgi:Carboxypeptidase regulatory-like domain